VVCQVHLKTNVLFTKCVFSRSPTTVFKIYFASYVVGKALLGLGAVFLGLGAVLFGLGASD